MNVSKILHWIILHVCLKMRWILLKSFERKLMIKFAAKYFLRGQLMLMEYFQIQTLNICQKNFVCIFTVFKDRNNLKDFFSLKKCLFLSQNFVLYYYWKRVAKKELSRKLITSSWVSLKKFKFSNLCSYFAKRLRWKIKVMKLIVIKWIRKSLYR